MQLTPAIIVGIIAAATFVILVVYAIIKDRRRKVSTGIEQMIGKQAVVQTALNPKGTVLAQGELWTAIAEDSTMEPGEEVTITKVEGLKLWVTKKSKEKEGK